MSKSKSFSNSSAKETGSSSSATVAQLSDKKKKKIKSRLKNSNPKKTPTARPRSVSPSERPVALSVNTLSVLLDFLRQHNAASIEGIFRVSASQDTTLQLYSCLRSANPKMPSTTNPATMHVVANTIKMYLSKADDPVCPYMCYADFVYLGDSIHTSGPYMELRRLVKDLPSLNFQVLSLIISYCHELSKQSAINKMTPTNCAIVFAPVLFRALEVSSEYIFDLQSQCLIIENLITNVEFYFGSATPSSVPIPSSSSSSSFSSVPSPTPPSTPLNFFSTSAPSSSSSSSSSLPLSFLPPSSPSKPERMPSFDFPPPSPTPPQQPLDEESFNFPPPSTRAPSPPTVPSLSLISSSAAPAKLSTDESADTSSTPKSESLSDPDSDYEIEHDEEEEQDNIDPRHTWAHAKPKKEIDLKLDSADETPTYKIVPQAREGDDDGKHIWKKDWVSVFQIVYCGVCAASVPSKLLQRRFCLCKKCDTPVHKQCKAHMSARCSGKPLQLAQKRDPIEVGSVAPGFTITDSFGDRFSLDEALDQGKRVIICFYPKAFSPGCIVHHKALRDTFPLFLYASCEIIGVSSDTVSCHKRFVEKYKLPYRMISDPENKMRELFQVPTFLNGMSPSRATYVIDPRTRRVAHICRSELQPQEHAFTALEAICQLLESEMRS